MATRHARTGIAHMTVVPENFDPEEGGRDGADDETGAPWTADGETESGANGR